MKILHICNDYSYSRVYKNLYQEVDRLGITQTVYHPLRDKANTGKNSVRFLEKNSQLIYSKFLIKPYHRILFRLKISSTFNDLEKQVDLKSIHIQYPTTLFTDGAVAYKIFCKYQIPYIVAVRNTDINLFLKYRRDLIPLAHKILANAERMIFISEGLKNKFYKDSAFINYNQYKRKTLVIPNGVDDFWLDNLRKENDFSDKKILFVGRLDFNKNAENLIKALLDLRKKYPEIQLSIVGGGGNNEKNIHALINENKDWITYYGSITDKTQLLTIYRDHNYFAMPSKHETFGLVYIEALSQGLPILYTKSQGVDGMFNNIIGESTLTDIESIKTNIEQLISRKDYDVDKINFALFRWNNIAKNYLEIFKEITKNQV